MHFLFFAALLFISDVQIDALSAYPDSIASIISGQIGNKVIYDCGDLVEHGCPLEEQEYQRYKVLFPNTIPVPGNHDWYTDLNYWVWSDGVDTYDSGIHIVGFDSEYYRNEDALNNLSLQLDDGAQLTILYLHHQIYSDNERNGALAVTMREYLLPIIEETNVDLVISGHGHAYERHYDGKRTYLVIGGGGAHLDNVGISETQVISASVHHWLEIIPNLDGFDCIVHGIDNTTIDSFSIVSQIQNPIEVKSFSDIKALFR